MFLLRPQALVPGVKGKVADRLDEVASLGFSYHLIRVWELPTEVILRGGLGVLPLAPITDVHESGLAPLIARVRQRLEVEMPAQEGKEFLLTMRVLMGLKYQGRITETLMQSILEMVDSVGWQKIYRSGKAEGKVEGKAEGVLEREHALLIRLATQRFGIPSEAILHRMQSINNADEISQLALKLSSAMNWHDLFPG